MCDICHRNPCLPRCPNADPPVEIGECANCNEYLLEGDAYYEDYAGNLFCSEECALTYYQIKEKRGGILH